MIAIKHFAGSEANASGPQTLISPGFGEELETNIKEGSPNFIYVSNRRLLSRFRAEETGADHRKDRAAGSSTAYFQARLLAMIERSIAAGTSTIICGRAGTGKTALAVDFALECGGSVAWYKVDAPDADPRIFFRYLVASIGRQIPDFGRRSLMPLVDAADLGHIAWLTEAFVYELVEGHTHQPLLIVIEDLHLVSDSAWLVPFFQRLLPLLPPRVHVLITSRSLPPAPLWRMRSKQFLVVVDEADLAFSRPEGIALFESYGLSSEQAGIALDHTHGRAASLDEFAVFLHQSEVKAAASTKKVSLSHWEYRSMSRRQSALRDETLSF